MKQEKKQQNLKLEGKQVPNNSQSNVIEIDDDDFDAYENFHSESIYRFAKEREKIRMNGLRGKMFEQDDEEEE